MPSSEPTSVSGELGYVIAPDDVLDIYIMDVPQLSREYRVGPDGMITLPLLSQAIRAQGLTPSQLSAVIVDRLRSDDLVKDPHLLVTVKSSTVHAVAIMGAVMKPQIYPVFGPTTLLDVLAQAQGLAPDASSTAIIMRGEIGMEASGARNHSADADGADTAARTIKVDLNKLLDTGDPSLNLTVYTGDKVTVERAPIVYVVGAVKRAGGFPMTGDRRDITVLKALALAESLSPTAERKRAFLIRENPEVPGGREQLPLNLAKILSGKAPDVKMAANDVLFIPDSAAKKAVGPAVQAALQTLSGLVIWRF
jgi:polysaccharide export outer membrane protein